MAIQLNYSRSFRPDWHCVFISDHGCVTVCVCVCVCVWYECMAHRYMEEALKLDPDFLVRECHC
jgi:chorismate mutase